MSLSPYSQLSFSHTLVGIRTTFFAALFGVRLLAVHGIVGISGLARPALVAVLQAKVHIFVLLGHGLALVQGRFHRARLEEATDLALPRQWGKARVLPSLKQPM
jgi:hypothetical protein